MLGPPTWPRRFFVVAATLVSVAFTATEAHPQDGLQTQAEPVVAAEWVGSWTTAMTRPARVGIAATGVSNTTLRQVVHLSAGGSELRLRFSNVFGTRPLVLSKVTVATRADGHAGTPAVAPGSLVPVTFDGVSATTIPAGAEWVSDPVRLTVPDDSDLVVSTYLPGPTGPLTQHRAGYATAFAAPGDVTGNLGPAYRPMRDYVRYLLEGVDVKSRARGSVVLFGDSITDGGVSPVDRNLRYPDQLADRLLSQPSLHTYGVLNAGISGNRLLSNAGTAGDSAIARFQRDVLSQTGARTVVVLEGINDIGTSRGAVTPTQLIAVYRQFIARARAAGLKVVGATLTPFEGAVYYSVRGEVTRQAVNLWIRNSHEYDSFVDFDLAVRDPRRPTRLLPAYDISDHLHPNAKGFEAMANAFDLNQLTN